MIFKTCFVITYIILFTHLHIGEEGDVDVGLSGCLGFVNDSRVG